MELISIEQLLQVIGKLHVENDVLFSQNEELKATVLKLSPKGKKAKK